MAAQDLFAPVPASSGTMQPQQGMMQPQGMMQQPVPYPPGMFPPGYMPYPMYPQHGFAVVPGRGMIPVVPVMQLPPGLLITHI